MDRIDNPIIRFRQPANQTSPDYREKFSLNAKHIHELKASSERIKGDKTIEYLLIVLLVVLSHVKEEERQRNQSYLSQTGNELRTNMGLRPKTFEVEKKKKDKKKRKKSTKKKGKKKRKRSDSSSSSSSCSSSSCSSSSSSNSSSSNSSSNSSSSSSRNNFISKDENDDILSKVDNLLKNVIEEPLAKINNLINMLEKEP